MLERVWRKGSPYTPWMGMHIGPATMETVWKFLEKLKIGVPYDPEILFLGIYLKK